MKKLILLSILLIVGCANKLNTNPDDIQVITSDIDRFWSAVDNYEGELSVALDKEYIEKGTDGLKDFTSTQIINAEKLANQYLADKEYYASIRNNSLLTIKTKEDIIKYFKVFKSIYPKAKFPDIYFLIGRRNSGGTASKNGLLIGAEVHTDFNKYVPTVIHELMHPNQTDIKFLWGSSLTQAIHEGGADFVASLVLGDSIRMNDKTYNYGYQHEKELWIEFSNKMHETGKVGKLEQYKWFYGGQAEGLPMMLGYFIGHQIAKSYYDKMEDKQKAIYRILNNHFSKRFLEDSGYPNF